MIYTLTANPAVDVNETCDGVLPNTVVRTRDAVFTPNGKGLNVSFTLKHFGSSTRILGFFAGFTGDYIIQGARDLGVEVIPVLCDGVTRMNLFLSAGADTEYKFVNAGARIDSKAEQEMIDTIRTADDLECLVISGSLPPGASDDFLNRVIKVVKDRGAEFILDISSLKLSELAKERPLLIKPNDDELKDIFGLEVQAENDVPAAMHHLHELGVKNVLLTLGGKGAYFSNGNNIWYAHRTFSIGILSTACAGDGTLGSFLSRWFHERDAVEDALKLCQAVGANVCEGPGLGDFGHVEEYRKSIEVRKL